MEIYTFVVFSTIIISNLQLSPRQPTHRLTALSLHPKNMVRNKSCSLSLETKTTDARKIIPPGKTELPNRLKGPSKQIKSFCRCEVCESQPCRSSGGVLWVLISPLIFQVLLNAVLIPRSEMYTYFSLSMAIRVFAPVIPNNVELSSMEFGAVYRAIFTLFVALSCVGE